MASQVDFVVCSVGTGGTICGIGHYLKQKNSTIKVVAVEPKGSTIFGGQPGKYLTAGSGMLQPSGIFKEYGYITDYYCQVDDQDSLRECVEILRSENLNVGITTGSVLVVASYLAMRYPDRNIVAIAPDGGEKYAEFFENIVPSWDRKREVTLAEYHPNRDGHVADRTRLRTLSLSKSC
jgi:cysteine synthase